MTQIAVAALVINEPRWRIKASYMAREALRHYLVERPRRLAREEAESGEQARSEANDRGTPSAP